MKKLCTLFLALLLLMTFAMPALAQDVGEMETGEGPPLPEQSFSDAGTAADYDGPLRGPELHSADQIRLWYNAVSPDFTSSNQYDLMPTMSPYTTGITGSYTMHNALGTVNLIRYVAGLSDNVALDSEFSDLAQHASVTMAANGGLSHYPPQPADMPHAFYEKAAEGASHSNLARSARSSSLAQSPASNAVEDIVHGFMEDGDASNIDRVGHRRWVLDPTMVRVGVGYVDVAEYFYGVYHAEAYSALYVIDTENSRNIRENPELAPQIDYVPWPAHITPYELYYSDRSNRFDSNPPFSLQLGKDLTVGDDVRVQLTSSLDGRTYTFSHQYSDGPFYVDGGGYGNMGSCLIFRKDAEGGLFSNNDHITVSVGGIYRNGVETPIEYEVNFITADDGGAALVPNPDGHLGWVVTEAGRYFATPRGFQTGWLCVGDTWYYMNSDGIMITGMFQDNGNWYYFSPEDGSRQTGWIEIAGNKHYFDASSGIMQRGWFEENGKIYFSDWTNGIVLTGWLSEADRQYYFSNDGSLAFGWHKIDGNWYYFDESNGGMHTGWLRDNNRWYYLTNSGIMLKNTWLEERGKWYYLDSDGKMVTGWLKDRNSWYYMDAKGQMVTGTITIDGVRQKFDSQGRWLGVA